jgi:isopentenyl diphosphate isomerase/L-lactate dehydrogenase-like FMN-dependent dehydrogenase
MNDARTSALHRRRFLQFLAASPLFAYSGLPEALKVGGRAVAWAADVAMAADITSAAQALNVFDLERVAMKNLPIAHAAYLNTGVEGDATLQANRDGFSHFQVRARRLVDTTKIDMSTRLFGTSFPVPIFTDPVSSLNAFHQGGDVLVAKATKARNQLHIYPTLANSPLEEVVAARGAPPWFQLYPTRDWTITQALVKRAESAGCPVVVVTVDNATSAGRETLARQRRLDVRNCADCHSTEPGGYFRKKSMFAGLEVTKLQSPLADHLTWDFVKRLRDATSMKVVLKGIVTAEDATLAARNGVDGVLVSNHGGRSEESLRSTIEALPEVVEAVGGRMPVMIDSGFRRGSDIFKALALGADAVGVGRPYVWGLAAFGQEGVERALDILRTELEITMRSMGAPSIGDMRHGYVRRI